MIRAVLNPTNVREIYFADCKIEYHFFQDRSFENVHILRIKKYIPDNFPDIYCYGVTMKISGTQIQSKFKLHWDR